MLLRSDEYKATRTTRFDEFDMRLTNTLDGKGSDEIFGVSLRLKGQVGLWFVRCRCGVDTVVVSRCHSVEKRDWKRNMLFVRDGIFVFVISFKCCYSCLIIPIPSIEQTKLEMCSSRLNSVVPRARKCCREPTYIPDKL